MTTKRRVLVLGLDGATWSLMTPWMEQGHLPTLKRLRDEGTAGPLASTIHPVTAPAWTSFLAGQQQGKHGIFDHVRRRAGSYRIEITNASMTGTPLLFDYLGQHGRRSVSLNVPYTFPARPIPGVMVSGLFAPSVGPHLTAPASVWAEIARVAPDYVVHPDFDPQAADPLRRFADALLASVESRTRVAEHLMAREPWDFFIVVFTATDQAQHAFWHCLNADPATEPEAARYRDVILDVYRRIDEGVARLLQGVRGDDETLVLVMSDHGFGPVHRWVNLNRWLLDEGYLALKGGATQRSWRTALLTGAASSYKRYLPVGVRAAIRRTFRRGFEQAKEELESQLFAAPVAWAQSRAYSLGACGNIFVNLAGREPAGIVQPGAEYEALRDELAAKLAELRDPEHGERIVERVYRREELYEGPFLEQAADLIIQWRDYGYWGRGRYDQNAPPLFEPPSTWNFSDLPLTGTHRPDGVLVAHGPGVKPGARIDDARLIDLAPTILAYLGLPIPEGLDGHALDPLFAPGVLQTTQAAANATDVAHEAFRFSEDEESEIMQRLEDLGYL